MNQAVHSTHPARAWLTVPALLFAASAAGTVAACAGMAAMEGMPMPGGWSMSMAWMRMPAQSWAGAAASFLGMWTLMMVAMMLPSLVPMLARYRAALGSLPGIRLGRLTALAGLGYFLVWALSGLVVYPLGVALAGLEMRLPALARAVPALSGLVVLSAGAFQCTAWKARHLACCRQAADCRAMRPDATGALRHGLALGARCCRCCLGQTAVLLVLGVMDLRAMALVTAAICLERLAPGGERLAKACGVVALAAGLVMLARGAGLA